VPDWVQTLITLRGLTGLREIAGMHLDATQMETETRNHEVTLHEYGHFVHSQIADSGPPYPVIPFHEIDVAYNPEHAFIEGFAEFFSAAARQAAGLSFLTFGGSANIEWNSYKGDEQEFSGTYAITCYLNQSKHRSVSPK
jgi:hypothetical protein